MKRTIRIFILMSAITGFLYPGEPLSFKQALTLALERNLQVKIAENTADIAANNAHPGNANLLPAITLSSTATYLDENTSAGGNALTTTNAQVQATYTLFDGLGNIYRFKKLQAGGRLGEIEARQTIENTLLQVGGAFYAAASAYENLQIARELCDISGERLDRAKKRSAYGQARTVDVLAAQVDYYADQVTLTQARFLWDETRRNLNVLLNRELDMEFTVETGVTFREDFDLTLLKQAALSANPGYLAAGNRLRQAGYDVSIARSQFFPRLDFSTSFGYSQTAPNLTIGFQDAEPALRIGGTLSFTLFNGFQRKIQAKNAKIQERNQALKLEQAHLDLEKDITSAHESFKNSLQVLELEKKYLEAADLNFKRTRELYNLGQVTTTQFREAQLNLIRSRSNLATAKYEAKVKEIELLHLSGQLLQNHD